MAIFQPYFSMLYLIKVFIKDPWIITPLITGLATQLFVWPYIFFQLGQRSDYLFLHYNIIFGIDLVGPWWKILYLPLGGLAIIILNFILSLYIYNHDKLISRMLLFFAALFSLFLVWAVYLTVDINL